VWDGDRIAGAVQKQKRGLKGCTGAPATYALTFYIGAGGKASSVGFSSPEPWSGAVETFGGCVVGKASGWKFTDPLGQITKSTFVFE
jgi:hypothetical protein